jgi:hypothetical protein
MVSKGAADATATGAFWVGVGFWTAARPPTRAPMPIAATVAMEAVATNGDIVRVAATAVVSGGPMTRTVASEPTFCRIRSTASWIVRGSADGSIRTTT